MNDEGKKRFESTPSIQQDDNKSVSRCKFLYTFPQQLSARQMSLRSILTRLGKDAIFRKTFDFFQESEIFFLFFSFQPPPTPPSRRGLIATASSPASASASAASNEAALRHIIIQQQQQQQRLNGGDHLVEGSDFSGIYAKIDSLSNKASHEKKL